MEHHTKKKVTKKKVTKKNPSSQSTVHLIHWSTNPCYLFLKHTHPFAKSFMRSYNFWFTVPFFVLEIFSNHSFRGLFPTKGFNGHTSLAFIFFWVDVTNGWFPSNVPHEFWIFIGRRVVTLNGETISRDGNLAVGEPQKTAPKKAEKFRWWYLFFLLLFFFSWGGRVRKENRKQLKTQSAKWDFCVVGGSCCVIFPFLIVVTWEMTIQDDPQGFTQVSTLQIDVLGVVKYGLHSWKSMTPNERVCSPCFWTLPKCSNVE